MKRISIIMKTPLWKGGINPEIGQKIRVDIEELQITDTDITYKISDTVVSIETFEHTIVDELGESTVETCSYELDVIKIRDRNITINSEQYSNLFVGADAYIDSYYPTANIFEKDILRPKVALLLFVMNDKIDIIDKCIYGTEPSDWEIV